MSQVDLWYQVPAGLHTRWSSPENVNGDKGAGGRAAGGRKGSPWFTLHSGQTLRLSEVTGTSGTIRRIWMTLSDRSPAMLMGLRITIYWDGAPEPAVDVPLGSLFGLGLGELGPYQTALFSSPEGRSLTSYIPMPFRTGMRIELHNESNLHVDHLYYDIDYTIGDDHGPEVCYFHALYRHQHQTALRQDFEVLPAISGRGRYLGAHFSVIADHARYGRSWWGEGEVKIYLDGDQDLPTLCGTGAEDYIGTGWELGTSNHLYQGCLLADKENMRYSFYRYHVLDPVYFHEDIKVTIQQIGCWGPETLLELKSLGNPVYAASSEGEEINLEQPEKLPPFGLFEREDNWSSCAYLYLDRPMLD
ncbi:glycoside hydrolase family 172 protein [Paenibacillus agaridevorans]|uniref:glycoside hydrolase family 172 protein n=1 Tax=Paenibacillus agaridevorans TaxID=171404 RepID=UPI000D59BACE|nr:glycoside hydrolase family 172 protein [Paenibacillus agaridevorans]